MKISIFEKKIPDLFKQKVITRGYFSQKLGQHLQMNKEESRQAIKELMQKGLMDSKGKNILYFKNSKDIRNASSKDMPLV